MHQQRWCLFGWSSLLRGTHHLLTPNTHSTRAIAPRCCASLCSEQAAPTFAAVIPALTPNQPVGWRVTEPHRTEFSPEPSSAQASIQLHSNDHVISLNRSLDHTHLRPRHTSNNMSPPLHITHSAMHRHMHSMARSHLPLSFSSRPTHLSTMHQQQIQSAAMQHQQQQTPWQLQQHRCMGQVKDLRPTTLDDVVRRHRNQGNVNRGFTVIEIYPNGAFVDVNTLMSAHDLGVPFRDAMLFTIDNTMANQKPVILVRKDAILFKSEAIRAVVNENKAYIIKHTNKSHKSYTTLLEPLMETVKQDDAIPFELNVLESLIYITCIWYDVRMKHIKSIMEGLMRDVNDGTEPFAAVYNEALIQQVAPLDKAITSLRNGARDTCEAVRALLEDEDVLEQLCLSQKKEEARMAASGCEVEENAARVAWMHATNPHYDEEYMSYKEQARRMLESYDRQLDSIAGKLEEMRENLDTVRDSWGMKLDSARNHIILLNLKMTLASLCLMLATLFPSWGGMNINHGLPDEPWVFWAVVCFGTAAGVVAYPITSHMYRVNWRIRSQKDLLRFHSLRAFLMEHLDDLDDVMDAIRKINVRMNRYQFEAYMKDQMPSAVWKKASLDFLFSQYDFNKDGFLEGMEVAKKAAMEKGLEEAHMPGYLQLGHLDELYHDMSEPPKIFSWLWSSDHHSPGPLHPHHNHLNIHNLHNQHHQHRSWWKQTWYGPQHTPVVEERSGGRIVRH